MGAYTMPEEFLGTPNAPGSNSTSNVGLGNERVIISGISLTETPWMLSSLLAHEGKRLSQTGGFVNVKAKTIPEKKNEAENDLKAYCTNIAVLNNAFRFFFNQTFPMTMEELQSEEGKWLRAQQQAIAARLKMLRERKKKAQERKVKYCA